MGAIFSGMGSSMAKGFGGLLGGMGGSGSSPVSMPGKKEIAPSPNGGLLGSSGKEGRIADDAMANMKLDALQGAGQSGSQKGAGAYQEGLTGGMGGLGNDRIDQSVFVRPADSQEMMGLLSQLNNLNKKGRGHDRGGMR